MKYAVIVEEWETSFGAMCPLCQVAVADTKEGVLELILKERSSYTSRYERSSLLEPVRLNAVFGLWASLMSGVGRIGEI